jgi:hypothetical protein
LPFKLLDVRDILNYFQGSQIFFVLSSYCEETYVNESIVEGDPELGRILLASLESFNDFVHYVNAFLWMAHMHLSA